MKRVFLCVILCCAVLIGCGGNGISQEEYDSVVAERDELKERVSYLESELNNQMIIETDNISHESTELSMENQETSSSLESEECGVEILAEYTLPDGIGWYTRNFLL